MAKKVAIFGDSILKGILLNPETKRYYHGEAVDFKDIERKLNVEIQNFSKMGCTVTRGKQMIEKFLDECGHIDVMVIEYGGNDADFKWAEVSENPDEEHSSNTTLDEFKRTFLDIIAFLRKNKVKPVLMTIPPISSEKYFEWISKNGNNKSNILYFLKDKERIYRYCEMFSYAIKDIAREQGVDLVDVRQKFLESTDFSFLMCEDGIHPNEKGEQIIVSAFLDHFSKNAKSI